jgi:hypothetical protein
MRPHESLAMISSSWIAVNTREQFFIGQLTGTYTTFLHTVGISGMNTVGSRPAPGWSAAIPITLSRQHASMVA